MNWWAWMNQQVHLKFKQSKITERKWKATCMHLSASKISVLAASKAFHYSCSKYIQIFKSEAEITYASRCITESSEKQLQYLPWSPFCSCGTAITQWVQQGILTYYGKCICLSSVSDTAPTGSTKLLLLVLLHLKGWELAFSFLQGLQCSLTDSATHEHSKRSKVTWRSWIHLAGGSFCHVFNYNNSQIT